MRAWLAENAAWFAPLVSVGLTIAYSAFRVWRTLAGHGEVQHTRKRVVRICLLVQTAGMHTAAAAAAFMALSVFLAEGAIYLALAGGPLAVLGGLVWAIGRLAHEWFRE
jgi:hypothetical protein